MAPARGPISGARGARGQPPRGPGIGARGGRVAGPVPARRKTEGDGCLGPSSLRCLRKGGSQGAVSYPDAGGRARGQPPVCSGPRVRGQGLGHGPQGPGLGPRAPGPMPGPRDWAPGPRAGIPGPYEFWSGLMLDRGIKRNHPISPHPPGQEARGRGPGGSGRGPGPAGHPLVR